MPIPAMFIRPKSHKRCQFFAEPTVAHASMVRFDFDEISPSGKSTYAEIVVGAWFPVVVPGRVNAAPVNVALVPTTTPSEPETESVMTVPAGAEPAILLKDQRFTMAARLEKLASARTRHTVRVSMVFKRTKFHCAGFLVKSRVTINLEVIPWDVPRGRS